jgi:hypothetical protein
MVGGKKIVNSQTLKTFNKNFMIKNNYERKIYILKN